MAVQTTLEIPGPQVAVSEILDAAVDWAEPVPPEWFQRDENGTYYQVFGFDGEGGSAFSDEREAYPLVHRWLQRLRHGGLAGKILLFWHNFFPVEWSGIRVPHHLYDYYYVLDEHALGNFKELVHAIGLTPAMLRYLDGTSNRAGAPNENYARELLERFTMGPTAPDGTPNYTEQDVREIARALTGWTINDDHQAVFDADRHDGSVKVILGRRGLFRYDEVIDILFEERAPAIAHHVCQKLYCFFVRAVPDKAVVAALAAVCLQHDFAIRPVLEHLFTRAHFFEAAQRGARIKSPIEFVIGMLCDTDAALTRGLWGQVHHRLHRTSHNYPFFPPNVGGWPGYNPPEADGTPGHYAWMDTQSLETHRWYVRRWMLRYNPRHDPRIDVVAMANQLAEDPNDPFEVALVLAEHLLPVPLTQLSLPRVERSFGDPTHPPPAWVQDAPAYVRALAARLLDELPHYNWPNIADGDERARRKGHVLLQQYVATLMQIPEYQLT